jgi:hypothetical protein
MIEMQAPTQLESFTLRRERLGPLPIINHVLQRMDLDRLLERHVPTDDARCAISHARALGALLRSIVVEREPIYRQQETIAQVLEAHKGQPMIEKRFEQLKTVHEIAPVFLKNEGRIEAFFTVYFLALLIQALIEREIRQAMKREQIEELPIYPEQRSCKRPTTEQILGLFSLTERQHLLQNGVSIQCFEAQLTPLQYQVLRLLGLPQSPYRAAPMPG